MIKNKDRKKILVTGVSGFIGSYIAKELVRRGYIIFGLAPVGKSQRIESLFDKEKFQFKKGDIRDLNTLCKIIKNNKIWAVLHLAALLPFKNDELKNPFSFFNVNARGTLNLLNAAHLNGAKRFLYASSISVYTEPPEYLPVDEKHPTRPYSIYGISKLEGELYCRAYSDSMDITILRYSGVYGKGQHEHNAVVRFIEQAIKNEPITIYGSGRQSSDFTYIKDIVGGTLLAFEKNKPGIYNLSSGQETKIRDLAKKIINLTKSKSKLILNSKGTNRPFRCFLDIKNARKVFGYSPLSVDEGLARYIAEFNNPKD